MLQVVGLFQILLFLVPAAQAQGIDRIRCNEIMASVFKTAVQRTAEGSNLTTIRLEDKKFLSVDQSRTFRQLVLDRWTQNTGAYGLLQVSKRDVPPEGQVFRTHTIYLATTDGKFRGRTYWVGEEGARQSFKRVSLVDQKVETIKFEMKVKREATVEEPYLRQVVDKPGIVMKQSDFDWMIEIAADLGDAEFERLVRAARSLTWKGKPVNRESDVRFLIGSFRTFCMEMKSQGMGSPRPNAVVEYIRDPYEYHFKRKRVRLPEGFATQDLPQNFVLQHTVDRDISIQDPISGQTGSFPANARANEIKIPLGYAKLYWQGTASSRQWFTDAGLGTLLEILDVFYLTLSPVKTPLELHSAGFDFIDGKGKLSTGSRLLDALN